MTERKDWIAVLTCCGRDYGSYRAATWAEANAFRDSFVGAMDGHDRSAIIYQEEET